MSSDRDELLSAVETYYTGRLREHGASARGVDWNSTESQHLRFAQLVRCLDPRSPFSINDFGCGYGELAVYLSQHGLDTMYIGYDISSGMIDAAREHTRGMSGCTFTGKVEELSVADYTVASGLFNVKLETPATTWEDYVWETIALLHAHSSRAFAFNLLTAHSDTDRMRADLFYADPAAVLDRCVRLLSRHAAVVHDYGLYEFTVVVRREPLIP
jgi:SAM-dependent methyltransferase